MNGGGGMGGNLISSLPNYSAFALGIIIGLLAFSNKISNNVTSFVKRRKNNFINSSIIASS